MTAMLCLGSWGGFSFRCNAHGLRLVAGWVVLHVLPGDLDAAVGRALPGGGAS